MSSCALLEGDTISCWGLNSYGQLGDGTTVDRLAPMPVPLPNIAAVSAGFWHTCALVGGGGVRVGGGGVRCWGYNASGQLGDGTTMDRASPPATDVLTGAIGVAAGENHTCALLATGRVRCWGLGSSGQLGNGATDDQTLPVDVLGMCP
jgi:alpha-tubulin suppressor-like RCC1 family protein